MKKQTLPAAAQLSAMTEDQIDLVSGGNQCVRTNYEPIPEMPIQSNFTY